ncbi:YggS family pyridoxal phosphate-dependent enzyme [Sporosarcina sp. Marseille-Q4063]|uniref:YggS family pyridoxal phosphate-dependent enzyme n=1 Tax=Sporosarcina sp. Marseille-Q4063 TaxID=2810514 RepID=UPI001BB0D2B8|nr:YggS family pyridoxal phosphate-dependent enzyme [Sporosarcina sp. Marseille-Q4063]QUW21807.1 YggS family pyridoxal phosphate-dependent enzyme [Sporosarcina sp. Marseille-Q4063]
MGNLQKRIQEIKENISEACNKVGREQSEVTVVAVTKSVSVQRAAEVVHEGIINLGENRAEGLVQKQRDMQDSDVSWHYIGNIQSRKVRDIVGDISYLHSLSRKSIAKEIQKRASKPINCFVQVNVSGEESKSGVSPENLESFINELADFDKIRVVGLMTMAPNTEDEALIRSVFSEMKVLRDRFMEKNMPHAPCTELSMGMSNDYTIAIEEGATFVRIGTALVGLESEGVR